MRQLEALVMVGMRRAVQGTQSILLVWIVCGSIGREVGGHIEGTTACAAGTIEVVERGTIG